LAPLTKICDGKEVVANRALAILKNGARRHRELIPAGGAFPHLTGREGIDLEASALRAIRFALIIAPAELGELAVRFLIRHCAQRRSERASVRLRKGGSVGTSSNSMFSNIKFGDMPLACQPQNHHLRCSIIADTMKRMRSNRDWQAIVKGVIRAELARRNMTYRELAERLEAVGVKGMNERTISNKINRGTFSTIFLVQCMEAIGCHAVRLDDG
jgi:hypothetical protein